MDVITNLNNKKISSDLVQMSNDKNKSLTDRLSNIKIVELFKGVCVAGEGKALSDSIYNYDILIVTGNVNGNYSQVSHVIPTDMIELSPNTGNDSYTHQLGAFITTSLHWNIRFMFTQSNYIYVKSSNSGSWVTPRLNSVYGIKL